MTITDLLIELIPFFSIPISILAVRAILNIVLTIARPDFEPITGERKMTGEKETINIDEDLQRYFNYKE